MEIRNGASAPIEKSNEKLVDEFDAVDSRRLIDQFLSLQWCRENVVIPLFIQQWSEEKVNSISGNKSEMSLVVVGIANFGYLATIGDYLKHRFRYDGFELQFIELDSETIDNLLDKVANSKI